MKRATYKVIVFLMIFCMISVGFNTHVVLADAPSTNQNSKKSADLTDREVQGVAKINKYVSQDSKLGAFAARQFLFDSDVNMQRYAIGIVGSFGTLGDVSSLQKITKTTKDSDVKEEAELAIQSLQLRFTSSDTKNGVQLNRVLDQQLGSKNSKVVDRALKKIADLMKKNPNDAQLDVILGKHKLSPKTNIDSANFAYNVLGDNQILKQGTSATVAFSKANANAEMEVSVESIIDSSVEFNGTLTAQGHNYSFVWKTSEQTEPGLYQIRFHDPKAENTLHDEVFSVFVTSTTLSTLHKSNKPVPKKVTREKPPVKNKKDKTVDESQSQGTSDPTNSSYTNQLKTTDAGEATSTVLMNTITPATPISPLAVADTYEPNNSTAAPYTISAGSSYNSYIFSDTDEDFYKVTASATGKMVFDMTVPSSSDYDVEVLDSSGNYFTGSYNGMGGVEHFTFPVTSGGVFFIHIYGYAGSFDTTNPYNFSVSTVKTGDTYESNNTTGTAYAISTGSPYVSFISSAADQDYYKITPSSSGVINVSLNQSYATNYWVEALDSTGVKLNEVKSWNGSAAMFTFRVTASRTYYLHVYSDDGSSFSTDEAYTLKLGAVTTLADNYEQNDTKATAYSLSANSTYQASIAYDGDKDYYKITPTSTGLLTIDFTNPTSDGYWLETDDPAGNEIDYTESDSGTTGELTFRVLANKTYYFFVDGLDTYDASQKYILKLSAINVLTDTYEPNDDTGSATTVSAGGSYKSYISDISDVDYYKLTPTTSGLITIDLINPTQEFYDVFPYDANNNLIETTQSYTDTTVEVTFRVLAYKTYYLNVTGDNYVFDTTNPYTLKLSSITPLTDNYEPNDTTATAYSISTGTSYSSYTPWAEDVDYFKFTPTSTGLLPLTLRNKTGIWNQLDVVDVNDSEIGTVTSYSDSDPTYNYSYANVWVKAGQTYYVRIATDDYDVSSAAYTLTLGTPANDTYEPNDDVNSPYVITVGQSYSSYISNKNDADYYSFTASQSGTVNITLTVPSNMDYALEVMGKGFYGVSDSAGAGGTERLSVTVAANTTYKVLVSTSSGTSSASVAYTLALSDLSLETYEPNDTVTTAKSINLQTAYQSYISSSTDLDYYSIMPSQNGYEHITMKVPNDQNYDVIVYDDHSNVVASGIQDMGATEEVTFQVTGGHRYYIEVLGVDGDGSQSETYSFMVSDVQAVCTYDSQNRLTKITYMMGSHSTVVSFTYDANGNLLKVVREQKELI